MLCFTVSGIAWTLQQSDNTVISCSTLFGWWFVVVLLVQS